MNELVDSLERLLELRKGSPSSSVEEIDRAIKAVVDAMEIRAKSTAQDTPRNPYPGSPWYVDKTWITPCLRTDSPTGKVGL